MRTLIVFESMFGNTHQVADEIGAALTKYGPVDVVEASEAMRVALGEVDLLVVGGPTHAFGMTRSSTRAEAVRHGAGRRASADVGIREWLEQLPTAQDRLAAATFDTRVQKVRRLPGSAARSAAKALRGKGYHLVSRPESFYVSDTPGPLIDTELVRARRWADRLGTTATSSRRVG